MKFSEIFRKGNESISTRFSKFTLHQKIISISITLIGILSPISIAFDLIQLQYAVLAIISGILIIALLKMKKLYFRIGLGLFFGIGVLFLFANDTYIQNESDRISAEVVLSMLSGVIGFFIFEIIKISKRQQISNSRNSNNIPRRGWNEQEKEMVRTRQHGVCNKCHRPPPCWQYHHRDGNRSNDSLSNCEALCPTCHALKTHYE